MHIKDRTFIVTGGSSGLGLATARNLHSHGGSIAILDLNAKSGEKAVQELGSERSHFFECDMVDRNNEPLSLSSIDFVLNINLRGTLDFVRQCLPYMTTTEQTAEGERGVVILVSSSAAFDGQPGQVSYAASKGAVRSMTLPMARDLAQYGIRVLTIAPSLFESNMTAVMSDKVRKSLERVMEFPHRAGRGEEFAELVKHGIENIMLNGEVIRLDGAMRMPSRL
ncbi:hypothetical protein MBLNU459_g4537t1 [Dothideomycetes sp. NU459]